MSNLRDIRSRIKSVKNTGQITRAMQLVAASKMKRAQESAIADRPYALLLAEILSLAEKRAGERQFQHPLFTERPVKKRGILVVSTDKGLCGGLNANLFRKIAEIKEPAAFFAVGKKATRFLSRTKRELLGSFEVHDLVSYACVRPILQLMTESYLSEEVDTLEVLYPRFINTIVQEPECIKLAPTDDLAADIENFKQRTKVDIASAEDDREIIFEPIVPEMMEQLSKMFLRHAIFHLLLEAKASEHSARMVAMKAATDNAKKLVSELTLQYNKARQAAITQEILEISAATLHTGK